MNLIKLDRGSVGNNTCHICNEHHIPQNKCRFEALVKKITKLSEANSLIPSILQANKQAVTIGTQFQILLKQADQANTILMEVLAEAGEPGEQIKQTYLERLDKWASEFSSQDTELQTPDTENSTLSETNDKLSTDQKSGETSPLILSP